MTLDDRAWMTRAFMLYVLGAYLFANGGQTVSLRWLALFCDFKQAWEANLCHACLAHFYSVMDTLSQRTLRQLVRPWKLLKVRFFSFSHVVLQIALCTLANCICFIFLRCHLCLQIAFRALANCTLLSCKLSSFKPYLCSFLANCIYTLFLQTIILWTISMLFPCKLYLCSLFYSIGLYPMVSSPMVRMWIWRSSFQCRLISTTSPFTWWEKFPSPSYHCMPQRFLSNHRCLYRLFRDLG